MSNKIIVSVLCLVVFGVIGRAIADGIPTVHPLTYSGVLQNSNGTPVTVQQSIQLALFDDATANMSVNQKCVTPSQDVTPDSQGRFRVQLDQACFDAVKSNPNLWVSIQVGGVQLPRTKIGAVPYAVESGKAVRAVLSLGASSTTADGLYCGASAVVNGAFSANGGALSGYRAAKFLCEQACGSRTSHMCSVGEVVTTYSLGGSPPSGWVNGATGVRANWDHGFGSFNHYDCTGWTSAGFPDADGLAGVASFWNGTANKVVVQACNSTNQILCCD